MAAAAQLIARVVARHRGGGDARRQLRLQLLEHRREEVLLGAEVVVERAARHARPLHDLLARRAREAPLGEESASGCQERAARRVRPVGLRAPVTLFTVDRHAAPNYTCGQPACN